MDAFLNWIRDNLGLIKDIGRVSLSLLVLAYTYIVHGRSKKRLNEIEARETAKKDLLEALNNLKEALERSEHGKKTIATKSKTPIWKNGEQKNIE